MTSTKYITYVYKIYTCDDKTQLFISSTREKLSTLLLFFIKNYQNSRHCNSTQKTTLYEWIGPLDKSNLKIKLIKSYPVLNKDDQEKREKYWIKKYKNYGYSVIHNPIKNIIENKENKEKIYVCIENTTMEEIIRHFGKRVLSISKEEIKNSKPIDDIKIIKEIKNPEINVIKIVKTQTEKELPVLKGEGYMNELKNLLNQRKNGSLSIAQLTTKKIEPNFIKKPQNSNPIVYGNLLEELKHKIKKIE
jgi:hypothetical protein